MYKNRLLVAILIISIIIAIPGCGRSAHAPENTMLNDIPAVDCYATLLDDSFIYFTFTAVMPYLYIAISLTVKRY